MSISAIDKAYWHLKQGKSDEAIPVLKQLVQKLPTYVTPHVLLAWAYEAREQWSEALDTWQHAYFLMPNSPAVHQGLQRAMKAGSETAFAPPSMSTEEPPPAPQLLQPPSPFETPPEREADSPPPHAEQPAEDESSQPSPTPPSAPNELLSELSESPDQGTTLSSPAEFDHLDRLIDELEAARIEPQPDLDELPSPDLENEIEDVVSETLARIYVAQKQYREAARVFKKLAEQDPSRSQEFLESAEEMQHRAREEQ